MAAFLDFQNTRDARNRIAYSTPVRCGALVSYLVFTLRTVGVDKIRGTPNRM